MRESKTTKYTLCSGRQWELPRAVNSLGFFSLLTRWVAVLILVAGAARPMLRGAEAPADTGSLVILCPVACTIEIPALAVKADAPKERLQIAAVPAGSYTATFRGFNRELTHTFAVTAGQVTRFTVKIAQSKVVDEVAGAAETAAAARPADRFAAPSFVIPDLGGATMVAVSPGVFIIGSMGAGKNEAPLTRMTLTRRYWLSRTEVTQAQWLALMETNNSHWQGPDMPMESVSWNEAMAFCQRLTQREQAAGRLPEGYFYVLPLEAQWEFACRAGGDGSREEELRNLDWYKANSGDCTHPAGRRPPNRWGFQDMRGNVAEWCFDWLAPYPGVPVTDYAGPGEGAQRVVRGGAFNFTALACRAASRAGEEPDKAHPNIGFRLALISMGAKAAK